MPKVNGSSPSHIAATPTAGPSQPTPSTAGVKRRASSPLPGMPPSAKQKKTASTNDAPADCHSQRTARQRCTTRRPHPSARLAPQSRAI